MNLNPNPNPNKVTYRLGTKSYAKHVVPPELLLRADDGRGVLCVLVPLGLELPTVNSTHHPLSGPWTSGLHPKGRAAKIGAALRRGRRVMIVGFRERSVQGVAEIVAGHDINLPMTIEVPLAHAERETFLPTERSPDFLCAGELRYGRFYRPTQRTGLESRVVWNVQPRDHSLITGWKITGRAAIVWNRPPLYRPEPPNALDTVIRKT